MSGFLDAGGRHFRYLMKKLTDTSGKHDTYTLQLIGNYGAKLKLIDGLPETSHLLGREKDSICKPKRRITSARTLVLITAPPTLDNQECKPHLARST